MSYLLIFISEARRNLKIKETTLISIKQKEVIICSGLRVKQIWKELVFQKGSEWGKKKKNKLN